MTFEDRMRRAREILRRREQEAERVRLAWKRDLLERTAAYERAVLEEFGTTLSRLEFAGENLKWTKANGEAVRGMLNAVEDLGYSKCAQPMKQWIRVYAPAAYRQGISENTAFFAAMGEFVIFAFRDTDATFLRASIVDAYKFANRIPAESTRFFRALFTRAMGERWTRKQLIDAVSESGKLTSIIDKGGRIVTLERRAEMFADYHLDSIQNMAQTAKDTEAFGADPFEVWDAVIDSHTAPISLERAGRIRKRSEWDAMGGDVFNPENGHPPLWPHDRCRTRAVSEAWFTKDEWARATAGEPVLSGVDREEYDRLQEAA